MLNSYGFELDDDDDDEGSTVFRDVIFLALAGFVAIVLMLLPHLNPPTQDSSDTTPGNVIVEIIWPNDVDIDVDLWVQAPGDVPVGYSNKGGLIFNLLRDDLGGQGDVTDINYEISYSRGIPEGEYTVNIHLYRNMGEPLPLTVKVIVSVKNSSTAAAKKILITKVELEHQGQEITVFRFSLNKYGKLVNGSVHDLPKPLRAAKKQQ